MDLNYFYPSFILIFNFRPFESIYFLDKLIYQAAQFVNFSPSAMFIFLGSDFFGVPVIKSKKKVIDQHAMLFC